MNHPATRMELLSLKAKKKLASNGYNLLKKKRDSLIRTFFDLVEEYKKIRESTLILLKEAQKECKLAQAQDGSEILLSLAKVTGQNLQVELNVKNMMGVKVEEYNTSLLKKSNVELYNLSANALETKSKYEKLIQPFMKLAEIENALKKLAEEIIKTKRRVNSLEYIRIPYLEDAEKYVSNQLAEMERENFTRLKNVKKRIST